MKNYLLIPSSHQGPSCLGGLGCLVDLSFLVDQEIPVPEAPLVLLSQGDLVGQETPSHLGLRLHDPPGNVYVMSQLPIFGLEAVIAGYRNTCKMSITPGDSSSVASVT